MKTRIRDDRGSQSKAFPPGFRGFFYEIFYVSGRKSGAAPFIIQKLLIRKVREEAGMIMNFEKRHFIAIAAVAIALALFSLILPIGS